MIMRYFLFGGDTYYAKGGGHDLVSCGQNLEALQVMAENLGDDYGWWHIFDSNTQEIICQSDDQAHGVQL